MPFIELHRINDDTPVLINPANIAEIWAAPQEDRFAPVTTTCYLAIRMTGSQEFTRYLPLVPYDYETKPEEIPSPRAVIDAATIALNS